MGKKSEILQAMWYVYTIAVKYYSLSVIAIQIWQPNSGGADRGGLIVRDGVDLSAAKAVARLLCLMPWLSAVSLGE